ncbi:MAG TPA: GrpB family protein [Mycobacteriales bacterium]|nr:GrpB family protein [Mycobacteriales bacterium]
MPFPDEMQHGVVVSDYQLQWPVEFTEIAATLQTTLGNLALTIDHIGSTSVPSLPAKDCIDIMVRVRSAADGRLTERMAEIGFRLRPETWNRIEISNGVECRKLVFAPPVGARTCNVHVREAGAANMRYCLLFRDYLRADERARTGWGNFKQRLAQTVTDIFDYGQIKAPATEVLMTGAERWATTTAWAGDSLPA